MHSNPESDFQRELKAPYSVGSVRCRPTRVNNVEKIISPRPEVEPIYNSKVYKSAPTFSPLRLEYQLGGGVKMSLKYFWQKSEVV